MHARSLCRSSGRSFLSCGTVTWHLVRKPSTTCYHLQVKNLRFIQTFIESESFHFSLFHFLQSMKSDLPSSMATPSPPSPDASPATVRTWLTTILCDVHSVQEEQARGIASKWKYGRGSELTYYDLETFRTMFGGEAGTLLFGHARRELRTGRRGPSGGMGRGDRDDRPKTDIFGLQPGCEYGLFSFDFAMRLKPQADQSAGNP